MKSIEIPAKSVDWNEEASFSSLNFITKANQQDLAHTSVISPGVLDTDFTATDMSHVDINDGVTFVFMNLTKFNGLNTEFVPIQYYGLNNGGVHEFASCYATDYMSKTALTTTPTMDFSTLS